jgi:cardiolipin synthase
MKQIFMDDAAHAIPFQTLSQRVCPKFMARLGESLARLLSPLL